MRWLGLDWDEGPEVGGPFAPYRQSERLDRYRDVGRTSARSGHAYRCYCTPDELEQRREADRAAEAPARVRRPLSRAVRRRRSRQYAAEGRTSVVRFRMPATESFSWVDLVRGEVTFPAGEVRDYVLVRANGDPLYTLVNPVDDALMQITHVLRGEDLLSSTPRQLALWAALREIGVAEGPIPEFGHLPYVMGEGNKKLSKRDPESNLLDVPSSRAICPKGMTNYLALLGLGHLRGPRPILAGRDGRRVRHRARQREPGPVRPEEVHGAQRRLDSTAGRRRVRGPVRASSSASQRGIALDAAARTRCVSAAAPLVQERVETLGQAADMLRLPAGRRGRRSSSTPTTRPSCSWPTTIRCWQAAIDRHSADIDDWSTDGDRGRRCGRLSSTASASSRGWHSARCGWRSADVACRHRCSSRWSCWGVSARSAG